MYKLDKIIKKTREISTIGNKISYVKDNNLIIDDTKFPISPMLYKTDSTLNNVWIKNDKWENYLINLKLKDIKKLDFNIGLNGKISDYILIFTNNVQSCLNVHNMKKVGDFSSIIKSKMYLSFQNYLIVLNQEDIIKTFSIPNFETPQWQFDLSQLGTFYSEQSQQQEAYKVKKFIGIHQDRLYVALNGGMLLEIDIATGELTHQWQNIMTTDRGFSYPVEPNTFTMDKQLGKLVSFYASDFITIDLASKKVNITPLDEELNKFDGRIFRPTPDNYAIDQTHIYTIVTLYAPEEDFIKQSIVAFNKQTKKIDWHYTDNQFSVDGSSPKIAGNKLYQKVNVSNLYIFEKTSNESI